MKIPSLPRRHPAGYTLMEIMLVLFIIALLLGSGVHMMKGVTQAGEKAKAKSDISMLETSLVRYKTDALYYPTQAQGLEALVARPSSEPIPRSYSPLVKAEALTDPWGNKYQYRIPGKNNPTGFDVFSKGPDGAEGTDDDIGNW